MLGKPAVIFGTRNPYGFLPSIFVCTNLRELPELFDKALACQSEGHADAFRNAAHRFKAAFASQSFDAADTILFRSGTSKQIPPEQLERAVDSFVSITSAQRDRLRR